MHDFASELLGISTEQFIKEYWQQKPLVIQQAIPGLQSPISADELAGLAMEDFVESRLVMSGDWSVKHGPFSERELASLPSNSPWTLLVQGVDQLVPAVATLLNAFRFLPGWRLDDIMVSFATDGGGVGPHFDQYDVFLLQAQGQRRWQLGQFCDADELLVTDSELAIMKNFNRQEEYILEPGDMLYLPPGLAHYGIAIGDCMTYSIGFRAPSMQEIFSGFCDDRLQHLDLSRRFRDQSPELNMDSYQLPDTVIEHFRQQLISIIDDKVALANWFGRYASTPRYQALESQSGQPIKAVSEITNTLHKDPAARFAYYLCDDQASLFVNGHQWSVSAEFAHWLCGSGDLEPRDFNSCLKKPADEEALLSLLNLGLLETD